MFDALRSRLTETNRPPDRTPSDPGAARVGRDLRQSPQFGATTAAAAARSPFRVCSPGRPSKSAGWSARLPVHAHPPGGHDAPTRRAESGHHEQRVGNLVQRPGPARRPPSWPRARPSLTPLSPPSPIATPSTRSPTTRRLSRQALEDIPQIPVDRRGRPSGRGVAGYRGGRGRRYR